MALLDRYIARQFLINTAVLAAILAVFVVAVDVSINLDRFERTAGQLDEASGQDGEASGLRRGTVVALLIADLWWPRLLQLLNFLLGVIMLGAMGFTCVQLMRSRELLAMLAAGQSLYRVARPILLAAAALSALQLASMELVIPRIAPLLIRDHGSAGHRTLSGGAIPLTPDGQGRLLRAAGFDAERGTLEHLFVVERDETGLATRVIRASAATWEDGGWTLTAGRAESRQAMDEAGAEMSTPVTRLETALDPARLTMQQHRAYEQALGFGQLGAMLARPEMLEQGVRDRLERLRYGRFAVILCNMLALIIALPFFVSRDPTGIIGRVLRCLPLAGGALMGGILGSATALPGIPPGIGVFLPALVLAPGAVAAMTAVRT